jgi:hypothetical protein
VKVCATGDKEVGHSLEEVDKTILTVRYKYEYVLEMLATAKIE